MPQLFRRKRFWLLWWLSPATLVVLCGAALGQADSGQAVDLWRPPVLPHLGDLWNDSSPSLGPCDGSVRDNRFPLFRMPPGFLTNPVGLEDDDDPNSPDAFNETPADAGTNDKVNVVLGSDNPYFDFHLPGDPGGIGYYYVDGQYQLAQDGPNSVCLAFRAVTPAGLEGNGLASGPTYFSPALAWYYELTDSLALHGFIGQHYRATSEWSENSKRNVRYGLAVQSPWKVVPPGSDQSVHFFLEALGSYHYDLNSNQDTPLRYQMVPGVHWQVGANWWMSGGMIVPLGSSRRETGLWQFTCSWRF
ncbi:MAG: hypothetical protein JO112_17840 [Planctomycetes bacterium]|nr:hypothetical protein [Planctomycetota bacterium]